MTKTEPLTRAAQVLAGAKLTATDLAIVGVLAKASEGRATASDLALLDGLPHERAVAAELNTKAKALYQEMHVDERLHHLKQAIAAAAEELVTPDPNPKIAALAKELHRRFCDELLEDMRRKIISKI